MMASKKLTEQIDLPVTILDNFYPGKARVHPYVHGVWNPVLPLVFYSELMSAYPTLSQVIGDRKYEQNARYDIDAAELLGRKDINTQMKEFIAAHTSREFWLQIVEKLGIHIRFLYPDLEDQVGKPLREFTVGVRNGKRVEGEDRVDVELDAKPGYNTPTEYPSSVRGQHIDNPHELFAALMYCRTPVDNSKGGDFVVDELIEPVHKWKWHGKSELYPQHFKDHATVNYSSNVACFFINTIKAVHHVTPRTITVHPRRLMNFIAEVRHPLFKIPKRRFISP